jgi:type IV secretion system coupling TraD/TrwB family protein
MLSPNPTRLASKPPSMAPAAVAFALSIAIALALGSWLFLSSLSPEAKTSLPTYLRSSIRSEGPSPFHSNRGIEDRDGIAGLYHGRTATFLMGQWATRVAATWAGSLLVLGVIVVRRGRREDEPRLLRGGRLRDTRSDEAKRRTRRRVLAFSTGLAFALSLEALLLGGERVRLLPEYVRATVLAHSNALAQFASPDGDGERAWFELDGGGFFAPGNVVAALEERFSHSALAILMFVLALGSLAGCFVSILLRQHRKKSRAAPQFTLGGVRIDEAKICYHLLISGSPGSGKSTAIKNLLDQIRARGRRAIVYDIGGEYVGPFFREGHDKLLNPFDARGELWSPWAEVRSPSDYLMLATSLFPGGGKDPFWADASAQLFAALLEALKRNDSATNSGLHHALREGRTDVLERLLEDTVAGRFLDPKAGAMPANVVATVMSKLGVWSVLDDPDDPKDAFSIRSFLEEDDDRWLFMSTREDSSRVMKPLLSLWCDLCASSILSLPETRANKVFSVLDEVASLQRLPALPALLERGRKHGVSVVLGLQAMPQLREAYGADAAAALVAQPQTWLVLRSVDPDTAHYLESALGMAEVLQTATSYSVGAERSRDGMSIQERHERRSLALASEIASLPDFNGYVRLPGTADVFRVSFAPKTRKDIARAFVLKAGLGSKV